jgi:hypothetical protein
MLFGFADVSHAVIMQRQRTTRCKRALVPLQSRGVTGRATVSEDAPSLHPELGLSRDV